MTHDRGRALASPLAPAGGGRRALRDASAQPLHRGGESIDHLAVAHAVPRGERHGRWRVGWRLLGARRAACGRAQPRGHAHELRDQRLRAAVTRAHRLEHAFHALARAALGLERLLQLRAACLELGDASLQRTLCPLRGSPLRR